MLDYVTIHGDAASATSRWRFAGASRANTDNGRLYVTLTQALGDTTASVFNDYARSRLVAQGAVTGNSGTVTLGAQNSSGLSGSVDLLNAGNAGSIELDVFYAGSDDLAEVQGEIAAFLKADSFAGEQGFTAPCASAKRILDALLASRGWRGRRFDSLAPLAMAASHYALAFTYDHLTHRDGEPAAFQANRHRALARAALPAVELSIAGNCFFPFTSVLTRA